MNTDIKEMEITDYNILRNIVAALYRMWKLKWIIVFSSAIGVLLSIAYITYRGNTDMYYSTASIYSAVYGSYSETVSGVNFMNNYKSVLRTSRVCERAAAEINDVNITSEYLKALVEGEEIYLSGSSTDSKSVSYRLDMVTVLDSPQDVVEITNAMAEAYVAEINDLFGTDILQVFDKADVANVAKSKSKKILVVIFAIVGFFLSAGIIFIKEFFSSKVYIVSQCEPDKNLILGLLPVSKENL